MEGRKKILVLIDGFNYYHKLDNYQRLHKESVKWLDYSALLNSAIYQHLKKFNVDISIEIIFFTAIAHHRGDDSVKRHTVYLDALKLTGVKIVEGEFKKKYIDICNDCQQKSKGEKRLKHEEKHTDVNIAITMLEKAFIDEFDRVYLLSEDNDYVPVVRRVKELFPEKEIIICPPPQRGYSVNTLVKASGESDFYRISWRQIKRAQFPDIFNGLVNPWKID